MVAMTNATALREERMKQTMKPMSGRPSLSLRWASWHAVMWVSMSAGSIVGILNGDAFIAACSGFAAGLWFATWLKEPSYELLLWMLEREGDRLEEQLREMKLHD